MSIWKSPVFYFGLLLLLVVTSALAAPYVVPWNNYRQDLQSFGEKLTGRSVAIRGDIAVKLFPWPQLEAQQVTIGNPQGFSEGEFIKADTMRVSLALAGLINGSIDVESIETEALQINLQRNASGDVNWFFTPLENVAGQGLLSRVKLDQIVLKRALVTFDDLKNGYSTLLSDVEATLSAAAITGPWRLRGQAKWNDVATGIQITSGEKKPDAPLNITVKLTPDDAAIPNFSFEGAWQDKDVKGRLRIDPQEQKGGKASAEGALKPLTLQADLTTSVERLSLLNIKVAPQDRKDSGTLIEGDAVVAFGSQAEARVELKSPRINLDTLLGAGAMQQWRDGGFLVVVNRLLANTPAKLVVDYKANVNVLTSGGQTLNDLRLSGTIQREALRVKELVADMPGRSVGLFDGIMFPGTDAAQLGGKLKFDSSDMRAFLTWLKPTWRQYFEQHWTGSRGRFELLTSAVNWNKDRFELEGMNYKFEGVPGQGSLVLDLGRTPLFGLNIVSKQIDIDSLVPNGWSILRDGGFSLLGSPLASAPQDEWQRQISIKANSILANGVTAQDVDFTVATRSNGLDVKGFKIGNVGGASLTGKGALLNSGKGPEGNLQCSLVAIDPRSFLRLIGLEYGHSKWSEALGQTDLQIGIRSVPGEIDPELQFEVKGSSGTLQLDAVSKLRDLKKASDATFTTTATLSTADGNTFARMIGFASKDPVGTSDVRLDINGKLNGQFAFSSTLNAFDAKSSFKGTADLHKPWLGVAGKVSTVAANGDALLHALGVPLASPVRQPLDVSAIVAEKDGSLSFIDVAGNILGHRLSGSATLDNAGKLNGDFETDLLHVADVLAFAFAPWEGAMTDLATNFPDVASSWLEAEIFVKPLEFETATAGPSQEVVVGMSYGATQRAISITSPGETGMSVNVTLKPQSDSFELTGNLNWPFLLQNHFADEAGALLSGAVRLAADFKSTGRSPSAALAAATGKGNYWLSDGKLSRMTLSGFAAKAAGAATPEALTQTLRMLEEAPGTAIGQRIGNFEIINGEMAFSTIDIPLEGATAHIAPKVDLPAAQLQLSTTVEFPTSSSLPPVTASYFGTPGKLVTRLGTSALAAKLGYDFLAKEMQRLEQLQQEQQVLAQKEEAQRQQDEKRFADYQATRIELRQQTRIRKFLATEREKAALRLKNLTELAIRISPGITKLELARQARRRVILKQAQP